MKTFRLLSLVFAMTALASPSQAGEFHLPGRPAQRTANLVRVVANPVRTVVCWRCQGQACAISAEGAVLLSHVQIPLSL